MNKEGTFCQIQIKNHLLDSDFKGERREKEKMQFMLQKKRLEQPQKIQDYLFQ